MELFHNIFSCNCVMFQVRGVSSPQGRDIDGKYLDANEVELKAIFQKWHNE
jgi:hypothetical protein